MMKNCHCIWGSANAYIRRKLHVIKYGIWLIMYVWVALNTQKWHQILCNSITKSFTGETGLVIHPLKYCEKATIGSVKDFKNLQISLYFVPAHSIYINT